MDYEAIIREKFPKYNVEVIQPDVFDLEHLVEYITDDITVYRPHSIIIYRHLIRFMMNVNVRGKMYYLENFTNEDLNEIYAGIRKFTWRNDVKINIFPDADPDRDVLGIKD
ncbi:hypothetical protein [Methanobrevibacter sp.]|uniref:hypothetical protein n=1 Tax=Methanobrevibacter sp. TaxID=66852 RepID=UPI00388FB69E